jgi:formamidopyrimidine-DNA glycosylase
MPELPEVETIRRDLEGKICGRRFTAVRIPPDSGKPVPVLKGIDEADFREGVVGARVDGVSRRGKFIVMHLDTDAHLVVHLRMTGALLHRNPDAEPDKYVRAILTLDDGMELRFSDLRKFGGFWLMESTEEVARGLGPEPLEEGFTEDVLVEALKDRKAPVKSIILDQRRIAGIGNIYADEALFAAGIDPRKLGVEITPEEIGRLHRSIRSVLLAGVESRGASFSDYRDANGDSGRMQMLVQVFRRTGKPCYVCGSLIERTKVGGRSTHFCPRCQNVSPG